MVVVVEAAATAVEAVEAAPMAAAPMAAAVATEAGE